MNGNGVKLSCESECLSNTARLREDAQPCLRERCAGQLQHVPIERGNQDGFRRRVDGQRVTEPIDQRMPLGLRPVGILYFEFQVERDPPSTAQEEFGQRWNGQAGEFPTFP